jgi:phage terminase large subunit-like protein
MTCWSGVVPDVAADLVLPTFGWSPPAASSFGAEAVDLAASAGLMLDPWQVYALDQILGEHDDGRPSAFEACLIVPRQNGKGSVLEALSLAWLYLTEAPLILHSAHEFKTAAEAFRRLRALIQSAPHLARRVEKVTTAAGNEAIELTSGQRLRYVARSDKSAIGFTSGKLILDEAFAISAEEMAAMLPTLSTQREAQLVYTSSAGKTASSQLRGLRDRGRAGGDASLCYLEWGGRVECPPDCHHELADEACALNDRSLWAASNPAWEIYREDGTQGITRAYVENERRSLVQLPDKFGRERLGLWDEADDAGRLVPLTVELWLSRAEPGLERPNARPLLALAVAPGFRSAAIGGASRRADGRAHLSLIEHRPGAAWVLDRMAELRDRYRCASVALNPASSAGAMVLDLQRAGWDVRPMSLREAVQATGALHRAVVDGGVVHVGDPIVTAALTSARRRNVGSERGWVFTSDGELDSDITPIVAVTEAAWALGVAESVPAPVPVVEWGD